MIRRLPNLQVSPTMFGGVVSKDGAGETILLLDDDQHFRQMITKLLTMAGYSVVEAQSAMVASALIAEKKPALAIVDYRLPGMNGITWIENMRQAGIAIPMVISTALSLDGESVEDLHERLNIPFVIPKPIDPPLFLKQIQALLTLNAEKTTSKREEPIAVSDTAGDGGFMDAFEFELLEATVLYLNDLRLELDAFAGGSAKFDVSNGAIAEQLKDIAHKVRGTSGSYGLGEISKNAGMIEDLLLPGSSEAGDEVEYLSCAVSELFEEMKRNVRKAIGERDGNSQNQAQARV
jgi:CheY-like chemotaxis protein